MDADTGEEALSHLSPEDQVALDQALKAMTEDDQAILIPYYVYGFSSYALADVMGLNRRTILLRLGNAIRRTRKRLGLPDDLPRADARDLGLG